MALVPPMVSALADDPQRFLERNAKIQWGVMLCVYGLSHAPALLLLDFPGFRGRGAFLLFFFVMVVATGQIAQELAWRSLRRRPVARAHQPQLLDAGLVDGRPHRCLGRRPALLDHALQARASPGDGLPQRRQRRRLAW